MIHLDETCYPFLVSQKVVAIPDSTECCWVLHRYRKELTGAEAPRCGLPSVLAGFIECYRFGHQSQT